MRKPLVTLAAFPALLVLASSAVGLAASPAEIAANRQAGLDHILTGMAPGLVSEQRLTCMFGEEPGRVDRERRTGRNSLPDAADICVTALVRTAHDGRLPELYRTLLTQLGGSPDRYETLPLAIGNAALDGNGKVSLGNGKQIPDVPPPLAFDAGFTVAYLKGDARAAATDLTKLKLVTEACLAVQKDAGTCFSAGYAQGGRAINGGR